MTESQSRGSDSGYIERKSEGSFKRLKTLRKVKSRPLIEVLKNLLLKLQPKTLPRSGLGKATAYTLNLCPGLTHFLKDAKIPLSNNLAERVLHTPVKGRDNYNGYRTINGADVNRLQYKLDVFHWCRGRYQIAIFDRR